MSEKCELCGGDDRVELTARAHDTIYMCLPCYRGRGWLWRILSKLRTIVNGDTK